MKRLLVTKESDYTLLRVYCSTVNHPTASVRKCTIVNHYNTH